MEFEVEPCRQVHHFGRPRLVEDVYASTYFVNTVRSPSAVDVPPWLICPCLVEACTEFRGRISPTDPIPWLYVFSTRHPEARSGRPPAPRPRRWRPLPAPGSRRRRRRAPAARLSRSGRVGSGTGSRVGAGCSGIPAAGHSTADRAQSRSGSVARQGNLGVADPKRVIGTRHNRSGSAADIRVVKVGGRVCGCGRLRHRRFGHPKPQYGEPGPTDQTGHPALVNDRLFSVPRLVHSP